MYDITLIFPRSPFLISDDVFPPLGILYLSAFLKKQGFSVQCLDLAINSIEEVDSKVVGISITSPQKYEAFDLIPKLRDMGVDTIIAGGPHATHDFDDCHANGFDYVIRGYGEEPLTGLLKHRNGDPDYYHYVGTSIDDYPFPDRDALPIKAYEYYIDNEPATVLMTSRGCPYNCSFCARISESFEMQSAERTIAEIEHINERYGFSSFMIFDDVFVANNRRLAEMASKLSGKYKFRCFARSNLIEVETCMYLKELGVVEVGIGVESGSAEILKKNMKGTTPEVNSKAVKLLHAFGIRVKTFLIVGLPGESEDTVKETLHWIEENQPDDVDISIFQPLPGSVIYKDPDKYGVHILNGKNRWYKGKPGEYECGVETEFLKPHQIVAYRDMLEDLYKDKRMLR